MQFGDARLPPRFWDKVAPCPMSGCWLWTDRLERNGYARIAVGKPRRRFLAHRLAYEAIEPIPAGLHIDHLCRVRSCVNPAHLEAVTPRTNVLRGVGITAANVVKTECDNGHTFDDVNTRFKGSHRSCRICRRADDKRKYEAQKAAGVCVDCSRPTSGFVRCAECRGAN
jgi:hypothetical protein